MLSNRVLTIGLAAIVLFSVSCKDNPVEPPFKDPRAYTWTIDTLAYPGSFQTSMRDIWGSSPNDVYVVGHNDNPGDPTMFRFDGTNWKTTGFHSSGGGSISGPVSLNVVTGFASNDIWVVGERIYDNRPRVPSFLDSSLIIHFNGRQWQEQKAPPGRMLQSIWGSSPSDIWTAGWNTLFRFNGSSWQAFPISIPPEGIQFLSIKGHHTDDVYMVGFKNDVVQPIDTVAFYLFHFDGRAWSVVDSVIRTVEPSSTEKFGGSLFSLEGILFSTGYGVFKKIGNRWEKMFSTDRPLVRLGGTTPSNLFAVGTESQIYHYDGLDWYRYPQFRGFDKVFTSIWTSNQEVFAVGNDGQQTYVLRGK